MARTEEADFEREVPVGDHGLRLMTAYTLSFGTVPLLYYIEELRTMSRLAYTITIHCNSHASSELKLCLILETKLCSLRASYVRGVATSATCCGA